MKGIRGRGVLPIFGLRRRTGLERLAKKLGIPGVPLGGPNRSRPADTYRVELAQREAQRPAALESARNGYVAQVGDVLKRVVLGPAVVKEEPRNSPPPFETQARELRVAKGAPYRSRNPGPLSLPAACRRGCKRGHTGRPEGWAAAFTKKLKGRATFPPDTGSGAESRGVMSGCRSKGGPWHVLRCGYSRLAVSKQNN